MIIHRYITFTGWIMRIHSDHAVDITKAADVEAIELIRNRDRLYDEISDEIDSEE